MFGLRHTEERSSGQQDAESAGPNRTPRRPARNTARDAPALHVLIAHDGRQEARRYILSSPRTTIGSDPINDVVIAAPPMPRFYVALRRDTSGRYLVESVGNNLLNVQGSARTEHLLASGDALRLRGAGGAAITLVYVAPGDASSHVGQRHELPVTPLVGQTISIGRAPDNDVVVNQPPVAEHHARLEHQGGNRYVVRDLDTVGGVYVNGQQVQEAPLQPGDRVRVGRSTFVFTGDALLHAPSQETRDVRGVRVEARTLREEVHAGGLLGLQHKVLLDDVSLTIPPGAFVALVGASGSGKTTLLNALSGQRPADSGEVLFSGEPLYEHLDTLGALMGYVPQDDIIHQDITVQRALYYAARLRLPRLSRRQVRRRVDEVLRDVDLLAQRRQLVSRLSGGQRKRVNIGVELLAKPPVFFLDEPTSGLDPGLDRRIMQLLRRLADRGHTIVLSTHATNNIASCDFVCFLAPGGRLAYFGPPQQLENHFHIDDVASIYNALGRDPEAWAEQFRSSREYREYVEQPAAETRHEDADAPTTTEVQLAAAPAVAVAQQAPAQQTPAEPRGTPTTASRPSALRQFSVLTHRYAGIMLRDSVNLAILLAQAPIIAALVVVLADRNVVHNAAIGVHPPVDLYAQRALFIIVASGVWFGIINAARELVKERPIYLRERAVSLSIVPYVLSKVVVLGVLSAIQSFVLLYIVGLRTSYPVQGLIWHGTRGAFAEMYITVWLVALSGLALGLCISALAPNSDRALSFVPIALVPQIIFASVTFALSGQAARAISWVVAARWGMEALGSISRLHDSYAGQSFAFYHWDAAHLVSYWAALVALSVGFLLLALLFLRLQDRRR